MLINLPSHEREGRQKSSQAMGVPQFIALSHVQYTTEHSAYGYAVQVAHGS